MDDIVARTEASPKARSKPILSPRFVQAMLAGHSALGLAFAALIYLICLTGTMSVFKHEIERWEQPNVPLVTQPISGTAIQESVWAGYGQALIDSASQLLVVAAPSPLSPRFAVSYYDPATGKDGDWAADAQGRLVARIDAPFSEFLEDLHTNLHIPGAWGRFLVGLIGVTLLSSLVSGILSHPRIFKDAFHLRWGGSERLQNADLHNRLAVWGLPFHVFVSLTGALLGLSVLIIGVLAAAAYGGKTELAYAAIIGPRASMSQDPGPVPDIPAMIRSVQATNPATEFVSAQIERPGKAGEVIRINMRTPNHIAFFNTYFFDGKGKPLGDAGFETGSVGQQILGGLQPVHYGWFGGLGTRLVYGVLGLALTIVTQSGVAIWLARRRGKGRPAPAIEKLWTAVTWGAPLALALTALWTLRIGEDYQRAIFVAGLIAASATAYFAADRTIAGNRLRLATAALLVFLLIGHTWMWWHRISDPIALPVSAVLAAIAVVVAAQPIARLLGGARL
jgi:uncharacterized iron-regulated membrane protein